MIASGNIPLKVPYKEKDEAKALGARWNPGGKHWYIPEGIDDAPFAKWMDGEAPAPAPKPKAKPVSNASSAQADNLDDINAMLRDAYETPDYDAD